MGRETEEKDEAGRKMGKLRFYRGKRTRSQVLLRGGSRSC